MRFELLIPAFILLQLSCTSPQPEYSEETLIRVGTNDSFIIRSYPHLELDYIWKYSLNDEILSIYTRDSLKGCTGTMRWKHFSGELYAYGDCINQFFDGKWKYFRKSGELDFINFYTKGALYQRWFLEEGDTVKRLFPKISIEPRTAYLHDTIYVRADYILDGIDTSGWDYYLHYDFIEREKYESQSSLPYEQYIIKYEGEPIESKYEFIVPVEVAMYGYTLAINRETGDSVIHLEIMEEYLTILDTTSTEL